MQKISIKTVIRPDHTKANGKKDIYIRLSIEGKATWVKIYNIEVSEKNWCKMSGTVTQNEPYYYKINAIINECLEKANNIKLNYTKEDKYLTFGSFRNEFYNKGYETDFFVYADEYINKHYASNPGTKKGMKNSMSKFKLFIKSNITFGAINKQLLEDYRKYCLSERENKEITVDKSLKNIGTVINAAIEEGKISENPVEKLKFKSHTGNREESLSKEEFRLLFDYLENNTDLSIKRKETLKAFLFACCTGLRWGDINSLKFENITDNRLTFTEHKTQKKRNEAIMTLALQFINFDKKFSEHQKVFDLPVGQTANKQLKIFAKEINEKARNESENKKDFRPIISEKITFHYSRRTLSTLLYNITGSPAIAAEIVGHSVNVALNHYAKIQDTTKIDALTKLENAYFAK